MLFDKKIVSSKSMSCHVVETYHILCREKDKCRPITPRWQIKQILDVKKLSVATSKHSKSLIGLRKSSMQLDTCHFEVHNPDDYYRPYRSAYRPLLLK